MCHVSSVVYAAGILSGLTDQTAAPGDLVRFTCDARGTSVILKINGRQPHPLSEYEALGYTITHYRNSTIRQEGYTITVDVNPTHNGTRISCTAYGDSYHGERVETEAIITVVGNH